VAQRKTTARSRSDAVASVLLDRRLLPKRFLMVSNRLPYQIEKKGRKLDFTPGVGGLVTALDPVLRLSGGTWIGWSGTHDELPGRVSLEKARGSKKEYALRIVPLTRKDIDEFYIGYSNRGLWPLFHNFQEYCEFSRKHWLAYRRANRKFAEAIVAEYQEGDLVWIHDYHLMLVPAMVRRALPDASIGFFLHIPFPAAEIFLIEPHARELLKGLMGADLIGFHVESFGRSFLDAVELVTRHRVRRSGRTVTADGRAVRVRSLPISIPYGQFEQRARRPGIGGKIKKLRDFYHAEILALGVDRLDYTKGIPERLRAIELMLERNPELQGKFTFVQISVPSRTDVQTYQDMRTKIEQIVGRINGRFAAKGCVPIDYRYASYSQEELAVFYRAADLALITPLKDGMNLVAKEYVASRIDNEGVLVLSRFAGAYEELRDAVVVNPYDPETMADRIREAIRMPTEERRERMKRLRAVVRRNDIYWWLERFLASLP
jgi:alpha,alpha-trehalose-phosphate synthase [UDP-forming]